MDGRFSADVMPAKAGIPPDSPLVMIWEGPQPSLG